MRLLFATLLAFVFSACLPENCSGERSAPVQLACVEDPGEYGSCETAGGLYPALSRKSALTVEILRQYGSPTTSFGREAGTRGSICSLDENSPLPGFGELDPENCTFTFYSLERRDSYQQFPSADILLRSWTYGHTFDDRDYTATIVRRIKLRAVADVEPVIDPVAITVTRSASIAISTNLWPYTIELRARTDANPAGVRMTLYRLVDGPQTREVERGATVELRHEQFYQLNWRGSCREQMPSMYCTFEIWDDETVELEN